MPDRYLYQPFRLGRQGGVAVTDNAEQHLADKVMAVLFTSPGERVNEPDFGLGLSRAVFEGMDDLLLGALRFRIIQGLRRDLGDEIVVEDMQITTSPPPHGELYLHLAYRRRSERVSRNLEIRL
jgi:phage baseplate assembly protein W